MTDSNKKTASTEKQGITPVISDKKRVLPVDQTTAIKNAIKAEKHFSLFRKIYAKNDKEFSVYSIFLILEGRASSFVEIQLLPDIGYVSGASFEEKKNLTTSRNAAGYRLLNWLYDSGAGIKLYARVKPGKDEKNIQFEYYALAVDENGISAEATLVPKTPGDEGYLRAAFAGFGKSRDFVESDLQNIFGLADAFSNVYLPGEAYDDTGTNPFV